MCLLVELSALLVALGKNQHAVLCSENASFSRAWSEVHDNVGQYQRCMTVSFLNGRGPPGGACKGVKACDQVRAALSKHHQQ